MLLVVAGLVINEDNHVLLAQRPKGKEMAGLWEFPGGKVNQMELPEEALARELKEEVGIDVSPGCLLPLTFASHAYPTFHILMPLFACRVWKGTPQPCEGQKLLWVPKQAWRDYPMPATSERILPILFDMI